MKRPICGAGRPPHPVPASGFRVYQAREAGFEDNLDDAFKYVRALSKDNVPDENIRAYVNEAAPMLRWMGEHTEIIYAAFPYPDYHAENPGGSPTGFRTHMPMPMDGRKLGSDVRTLRFANPAASLFGYLNWHFDETYALLYRAKGWWLMLTKMLAKYWLDLPFRLTSRKDRRPTLGNSLAGGLRLALKEKNVPLWLETPLVDLVKDGDAVTGAVVTHKGRKCVSGPVKAWCWPPAALTKAAKCAVRTPPCIRRPCCPAA